MFDYLDYVFRRDLSFACCVGWLLGFIGLGGVIVQYAKGEATIAPLILFSVGVIFQFPFLWFLPSYRRQWRTRLVDDMDRVIGKIDTLLDRLDEDADGFRDERD